MKATFHVLFFKQNDSTHQNLHEKDKMESATQKSGWKISESAIFETVEIDETNRQRLPLSHESKGLILKREDSKFCIMGCKWVFKISRPQEGLCDDLWEIFNGTSCELHINDLFIEKFQFTSYEPFEKLFRIPKDQRRNIFESPGELSFTIPMLFGVFVDGRVLPLVDYNHITFRLKMFPRPEGVIDISCLVTYARYPNGETVGNMVRDGEYTPFSNFNLYSFQETAIICQKIDTYNLLRASLNCLWPTDRICELNFTTWGSKCGFCIAFIDNLTKKIIRKSLLKSAKIRIPKISAIDFEFQNTDALENTQVDCSSAKPSVFPIEVWRRILHFCEDPGPLMRTCKFLWKCSHQFSIHKEIEHRLFRARGWYLMPFNAANELSKTEFRMCAVILEFLELAPLDISCIVIDLDKKSITYDKGFYGSHQRATAMGPW